MKTSADSIVGVILSGAYVNDELVAEYGLLPPAFLPFSQRRLFEHQVEALSPWVNSIILTVPASYKLHHSDKNWLSAHKVRVITIPDGLSLGESVSYTLIFADIQGSVYMLHGDTLLPDLRDFKTDSVAVAAQKGSYLWGRVGHEDDSHNVLVGLFSFSSADKFLVSLEVTGRNFVDAIVNYSTKLPLQRVEVSTWLDFGHLQNLYRARKHSTTQRHFNSLEFEDKSVFKTGTNIAKLKAESDWYENLPASLRIYTPPFLGWNCVGYRLGYETSPNLHDLFVFGEYRESTWQSIANACFDFLRDCQVQAPKGIVSEGVINALTSEKTLFRLQEWCLTENIKIEDQWTLNGAISASPAEILAVTSAIISQSEGIPGIMHGDFCFSNIFFDFRQQSIRVIDPRGEIRKGYPTVFGDLLYDLAKLNHSLSGYDQIIAGRFQAEWIGGRALLFDLEHDSATEAILELFTRNDLSGHSLGSAPVKAITIQLFLAMLPLHADRPDRQLAFFANALRLYRELET